MKQKKQKNKKLSSNARLAQYKLRPKATFFKWTFFANIF